MAGARRSRYLHVHGSSFALSHGMMMSHITDFGALSFGGHQATSSCRSDCAV